MSDSHDDSMEALSRAARALEAGLLAARSLPALHESISALYPDGCDAARAARDAAQLWSYALWAARCLAPSARRAADADADADADTVSALSATSPLLRQLLSRIAGAVHDDRCANARSALERVVAALQPTPREVLESYEQVLAACDPAERRGHGVYYTPPELVAFLLEHADRAMRDELGMREGLLSETGPDGRPFAILDPAAGTGAFLVGLLARAQPGGERRRLASRLRAFELLPVPYAICHMQIALYLATDTQASNSNESIDVCLASALDEAPPSSLAGAFGEALRAEHARAAALRASDEVAVIVGNPPFRRGGAQGSRRRRELLRVYKTGLEAEPNVQPLSDAYLLFLRAAEERIERRSWGVVGLVTPSAYLQGRLHRAARGHLRGTFSAIDVLDLHGSVRGQRPALRPGLRDENVFAMSQGVAISILSRGGAVRAPRYAELSGARTHKLDALRSGRVPAFRELACTAPLYLLSPGAAVPPEYAGFVPLDELFSFHSVGGKPGADKILVDFEPAAVLDNLARARRALEAGRAPQSEAERKLAAHLRECPGADFARERVRPYLYRPFDVRYAYDDPRLWTRPVLDLRAQIDGGPLLLTSRVVKDGRFAHVLSSRTLPDVIALSATSSVNCHVFPMRALRADRAADTLGFAPERAELFAYVYAVLHSPSYRERYLAGLRHDYPRIPLSVTRESFVELARCGGELLALHLGERRPRAALRPRFHDGGGRRIDRVGGPGRRLVKGADGAASRLAINQGSFFEPIAEASFEHRVGGYQVLYKWLDDRRRARRHLSDAEIERYRDVAAIVAETVVLMSQADELVRYPG